MDRQVAIIQYIDAEITLKVSSDLAQFAGMTSKAQRWLVTARRNRAFDHATIVVFLCNESKMMDVLNSPMVRL
jgi:hypothetical protein